MVVYVRGRREEKKSTSLSVTLSYLEKERYMSTQRKIPTHGPRSLFQNLAEPRVIDLDVGFEVGN
jgi:hypothetical protein